MTVPGRVPIAGEAGTHRWRGSMTSLLVFLLLVVSAVAAETKATTPDKSAKIKITVHTSREQSVAFSDFGIYADIENVSSIPLYFHPRGFTLTVPPEVNPSIEDWYAVFPGCPELKNYTEELKTRIKPEDFRCDNENLSDRFDRVVELAPGSRTLGVWNANAHTTGSPDMGLPIWKLAFPWAWWKLRLLWDGIGFPVGKYTFRIVGGYWDTRQGAQKTAESRGREIAEIEMNLIASQEVILFGAALGGAAAFLLLPNLRVSGSAQPRLTKAWFRDLVTSMLLSVVIAILLSRLSETQFLIKVNVNDFWGAIAIGFIAAASGTKALQKLASI